MRHVIQPCSVIYGMSLLQCDRQGIPSAQPIIKLARLEICRRGSAEVFDVFEKQISRSCDEIKIDTKTLDELGVSSHINFNYRSIDEGSTLRQAVCAAILIENYMLGHGWQVFDRDRAQRFDGLEMVARQWDIVRFLPALPFSQKKQFTPLSRPAYR